MKRQRTYENIHWLAEQQGGQGHWIEDPDEDEEDHQVLFFQSVLLHWVPFFGCLCLDSCPGQFALQWATRTRKEKSCSWKATNIFKACLKNELNKQIRKDGRSFQSRVWSMVWKDLRKEAFRFETPVTRAFCFDVRTGVASWLRWRSKDNLLPTTECFCASLEWAAPWRESRSWVLLKENCNHNTTKSFYQRSGITGWVWNWRPKKKSKNELASRDRSPISDRGY